MQENQQINSVPVLQIRHSKIVVYNEILNRRSRSEKQRDAEKNLTQGDYNGYMSRKTKTKVIKMLEIWINSVMNFNRQLKQENFNQYVTFVTLTLSEKQKHDDNYLKRNLLMRFIERVKDVSDMKYYFWRAEPQESGNIHFHLFLDSFVDRNVIRDIWNNLLKREGYKRSGAATQIHRLEKVQNVTAYVVKYCCKTPPDSESKKDEYDEYVKKTRKIQGRIWGCSDQLRNLRPYSELIDSKHSDFITKLDFDKSVDRYEDPDGDFTVYKVRNVKEVLKKYSEPLFKLFTDYHKNQILELYRNGLDFQKNMSVLDDLVKDVEIPKPEFVQLSLDFKKRDFCPF